LIAHTCGSRFLCLLVRMKAEVVRPSPLEPSLTAMADPSIMRSATDLPSSEQVSSLTAHLSSAGRSRLAVSRVVAVGAEGVGVGSGRLDELPSKVTPPSGLRETVAGYAVAGASMVHWLWRKIGVEDALL
jgi:hypothetical protein